MYDTLCDTTDVPIIGTNVVDVNKFMKNVTAIRKRRDTAANGPRKMNEFIREVTPGPSLEPLFGEFWREGELAMLFGAPGLGKSLLAMQIGDALARGSGIDGFAMPSSGRRVLYVDLQHAEFQLKARYADRTGRRYSFSEKIFRDRPPADTKDFVGWLRETLKKRSFDIVVIDDIDSLKTTCDGSRETLTVMRDLRRLRDEIMVSILVLTESNEPRGRHVSDADLGRSRVLCSVADSVFALSPWRTGECRVVQVRSRNAPVVWTAQTAPIARINRLTGGMLGFQFDERFVPELTQEENDLLFEIKTMQETGRSLRAIGEELGKSKSSVHRLLKKHQKIRRLKELGQEVAARLQRQAMFGRDDEEYIEREAAVDNTFPGCDEYDEAKEDASFDALESGEDSPEIATLRTEFYNIGLARSLARKEYEETGLTPRLAQMMERLEVRNSRSDVSPASVTDSTVESKPKGIFDLPLVVDRYGRKMYVEKEEHHTRRPEIFYTVNPRSGQVIRYVRRGFGVFGTVMKDANLPEKEEREVQ